jgi:hypothetical protein
MKKNKKIIISATLFIISILIAPSAHARKDTSNYTKSPTKIEKKTEKESLSFFGFTLGENFSKELAIYTSKSESGETLYEVNPKQPLKNIHRYFLTIDENRSSIKSIRGKGIFSSKKEGEVALNYLENVIKKKYSDFHPEEGFKYYKNENGDILIMFLKPVNGKHEIHLHCFVSK